ncbi:MAG: hypothetical protein IKJ57_03365 [Oscillospiraceae bacterium]|nr:hypothetical protein [Oscillospiraceae bacterium]
MKKYAVYFMILILAFAFYGCGPEKILEDEIKNPEPLASETEEQEDVVKEEIAEIPKQEENEYPELKELCLMAKDALYFHCHTMDGIDFFEYGGFESPEEITEEGILNFFIAKNDGEKYLGADKMGYHIPKKDIIDFCAEYFYDVSFLEELLDERYSVRFFSAYNEENVIFNENPEMKIEGDRIFLKTDDYEAVFRIHDGKTCYESFKVSPYKKWGLQTEIFATDAETEKSTDERICITSCAYPDWSYVRTNDGRYISSREEPFTYYEKIQFYSTNDFFGPFGSLTVYKDTGTTYDDLLKMSSILVFEEDIIPVENLSPGAEKACYVKMTYPSKDGESTGYQRTYIVQFEGYVAFFDAYIYYSEQKETEGKCEEFISGLRVFSME